MAYVLFNLGQMFDVLKVHLKILYLITFNEDSTLYFSSINTLWKFFCNYSEPHMIFWLLLPETLAYTARVFLKNLHCELSHIILQKGFFRICIRNASTTAYKRLYRGPIYGLVFWCF